MTWDDEYARARVARAEELLAGLEALPDSAAAARAVETVETLVDIYGECLARIMDHLGRCASGDSGDAGDADRGDGAGDGGTGPAHRLAADELVGHLLLVHDLHPDPPETRVRRALEALRRRPAFDGSEAELLEVSGTTARIRLRAGGRGCSSSAPALERAVREAVSAAAPEIGHPDVETVPVTAPAALIPVDSLFRKPALTAERGG
ncbi:nitrogen fixation protein NifU [Streptomyces carminius]|uniref:Nitrogen fixation protein NifU n=1 Tax=Streptomyces carminius TaxID=2665496 RepID=A0A2M8MCD1_9ACTN|nr:NifU family protein [Streptomyces carminius]PJE98033.1 nitrogen fixation protein NifU [Streptomyces carminius]PJF01859.1 nitrogen fixation protein NifU [Streptomyces carminius]